MNKDSFGVALTNCFFCVEPDKIVMNTRLMPETAARVNKMNHKVIDMEPCLKCRGFMDRRIIIITIDSEKSSPDWNKPPIGEKHWMPNPYRSGGFFVITEDCMNRLPCPPEMIAFALKHRWIFMEHEAAKELGFFDAIPTETEELQPDAAAEQPTT